MDAKPTAYTSRYDNWRLVYELLADSLVIKGRRFDERMRHLYELKNCRAQPDREVRVHHVPFGSRFRTITRWVLLGTAILFAVSIAITTWLIPLPKRPAVYELILAALAVLLGELLILSLGLAEFLTDRVHRRYVTFLGREDGLPCFTFVNAEGEPVAGFEEFVSAVTSAIQRVQADAKPLVDSPTTYRVGVNGPDESPRPSSQDGPMCVFEATDLGWKWIYSLYPDHLAVEGRRGDESKCLTFALNQCDDAPARDLKKVLHPTPRRYWVFAITAGLTIFAICAGLAYVLDQFTSHRLLVGVAMFTGTYANAIFLACLSEKFRNRAVRRYFTFRHSGEMVPWFSFGHTTDEPSDAVELIVWTRRNRHWNESPIGEPVDEFEQFLHDLTAAIRRVN